MIKITFNIKYSKFEWMDWIVNHTVEQFEIKNKETCFTELTQKGNKAILKITFAAGVKYSIQYLNDLVKSFLDIFEYWKQDAAHWFISGTIFSINPIDVLIK